MLLFRQEVEKMGLVAKLIMYYLFWVGIFSNVKTLKNNKFLLLLIFPPQKNKVAKFLSLPKQIRNS